VLERLRSWYWFHPFNPPPNRDLDGWGTIDSETAQHLQAVLDAAVNRFKVTGLQASIRFPDNKTWSGVSGTVDLKRKVLLRRDHIMRIGSHTKTFTAALILKLVEEDILHLKDPLSYWFPKFPNAEEISIRQLLNHTSGIFNCSASLSGRLKTLFSPWRWWKPLEKVNFAAQKKPYFKPGVRHQYSNTNYILLGLIAERATGKTAAELFRQRLFDQVGLKNTYFVPYEEIPAKLSSGFDRDLVPFVTLHIKPDNTAWPTEAFTAGAIVSTADELVTWLDALLGGKVLTPSMLTEMTNFVDVVDGPPDQNGYGLGLIRYETGGDEVWGHSGTIGGFSTYAMWSPYKNYTIAIIANLCRYDRVSAFADLQKVLTSRITP